MSNNTIFNQLKSSISKLSEEELIPALYLMEVDNEFRTFRNWKENFNRKFLSIFTSRVNSIKELNEIRLIIYNNYYNLEDHEIDSYINEIDAFKNCLKNRSRDLSSIKNNYRFLMFILNLFNSSLKSNEKTINDINNEYYRFLVLIFCHPFYSRDDEELKSAETIFSKILNKHMLHFPKHDSTEFYIWAKDYMDKQKKYNSYKYSPISTNDYKDAVNIVFDSLFHQNEDIYNALKEPLTRAWYQKDYRQKNKGKKSCHYALAKHTRDALHILAFKHNITEDKMIEQLINKCYIKECVDTLGNSLY